LKNRGYAASCRIKRLEQKGDLEMEKGKEFQDLDLVQVRKVTGATSTRPGPLVKSGCRLVKTALRVDPYTKATPDLTIATTDLRSCFRVNRLVRAGVHILFSGGNRKTDLRVSISSVNFNKIKEP